MLSSHEKESLSRIIHDISNPLSVIYSSLHVIQMQHPEVSKYKYWEETLADIEELKLLLQTQTQLLSGINVNT